MKICRHAAELNPQLSPFKWPEWEHRRLSLFPSCTEKAATSQNGSLILVRVLYVVHENHALCAQGTCVHVWDSTCDVTRALTSRARLYTEYSSKNISQHISLIYSLHVRVCLLVLVANHVHIFLTED